MLHSTRVIDKVLRSLNEMKVKKIILDPVMIAKGGSKLITDSAVRLMKKKLIGYQEKTIVAIIPTISMSNYLLKLA